ncbi:MAG: hypothetical protein HY606_13900 [Planctomycetes bacterium]|nr:hypothetical protein [Planctomycetota bacterium]
MKYLSILILFLIPLSSFADEVVLKNGATIYGSIVTKDGDYFEIRTKGGMITVKTKDVLYVDNSKHIEFEKLYSEYLDIDRKDVDALVDIAKKSYEKQYTAFHSELIKEIVSLEPNNTYAIAFTEKKTIPAKSISTAFAQPKKSLKSPAFRAELLLKELKSLDNELKNIQNSSVKNENEKKEKSKKKSKNCLQNTQFLKDEDAKTKLKISEKGEILVADLSLFNIANADLFGLSTFTGITSVSSTLSTSLLQGLYNAQTLSTSSPTFSNVTKLKSQKNIVSNISNVTNVNSGSTSITIQQITPAFYYEKVGKKHKLIISIY